MLARINEKQICVGIIEKLWAKSRLCWSVSTILYRFQPSFDDFAFFLEKEPAT